MAPKGQTDHRHCPPAGDPLRSRFAAAAHRQGFTLLEVMLAMTVIALVLVAVFRMNAQSVSMSETARFQSLASLLAQQKLAQTLASVSDPNYSDAGSFDEGQSSYRWQIDMAPVEPLTLADDRVLKLRRIDVQITRENSPLRYTLRTYRVR